ncbi:MAG: hypothetical protein Q9224_000891 [Gallowayella concinna]
MYQPEASRPRIKSVNGTRADSFEDWEDLLCFQCSTTDCSAKVKIHMRSPRLRPDWVTLLTDKAVIKSRASKAMLDDPSRFEGHAVPFPSEVLSNLRTYILNARRDGNRRSIAAHNKRWLLCLGDPCSELLEYIGFVHEDDSWLVPGPDATATPPFTDPTNVLLEDVEKELLALLLQRPDDEKRASKVQYGLTSASRDLALALGTSDCKTMAVWFPSLGAKLDFHDDLIKFAYERQLCLDPEGVPYYLEALQGIAKGRESEDLQTSVAIEASSGKVSAEDIRIAYKALGIDDEAETLYDDYIIGNFQSRAADSPRQEPELRRALQIIGQHRSSPTIQSMASKTILNLEQALSWLGATDDMDDGFIVTMYKVKVCLRSSIRNAAHKTNTDQLLIRTPIQEEENPAEESTARHAVSLIAQHRNSSALKQWLETGALGEVDMDIGQAYNRFQIEDRSIDDSFVLSTFQLAYSEAPSQVDDLRSALKAIAKHRNSSVLHSFLNNSGMATMKYPLAEWPVGLNNIGNTCYLNSLLQFYFAMKPFRNLVLDIEAHKRDLTADDLAMKTIGSRHVSRQEVQRAQRFVYELQGLFQDMIASPTASVKPKLELACLTLLSRPGEANLRRRSTIGGQRPSLGEHNGRPIQGPLGPPIMETDGNDANASDRSAKNGVDELGEDRSSQETLLGNDPAEEAADEEMPDLILEHSEQQQRKIFEDKENLPPTKEAIERPTTPDHTLEPLAETSPSRTNEQHRPARGDHDLQGPRGIKKPEDAVIAPPNRPPPCPPRPTTEVPTKAEVEMSAQQQDVTEVIENFLYQMECAIKATSFDSAGEQMDQIKDMFFGKQTSYTQNLQNSWEKKEQLFSTVFVDVASGPKSIYEALDGAFDVQEVEVEGALRPQYSTISQLPPVLNILVQRAQYNKKQNSAFKSLNHLELKETVYMDRYVDSEDQDLIERRTQSWDWKRQLGQLEARRHDLMQTNAPANQTVELIDKQLDMDVPDLLTATGECLLQLSEEDDDYGVTKDLQVAIKQAAAEARKELDCNDSLYADLRDLTDKSLALNNHIKDLTSNISSQFVDRRNLPYRLQSVFIHRGSATAGHYWIYIRDFKQDLWREYNDDTVSAVTDQSRIFAPDPGQGTVATPYFLVYVREDVKDEYIDPVCRDIPERAKDANTMMEGITMNNGGSYETAVESGQGTTDVSGDWFEADYVKPVKW